MTRGGRKGADETERRCIVTGETGPKAGLLRFVRDPEGRVVADVLNRLPGRGAYVTARREVIAKAVAKGAFARAFGGPATAPERLIDDAEAGLVRRVLDLVSMARKAGQAVTGFEKVKDWLTKGDAEVLIQAFDGSERGRSKLYPPDGEDSLITCLSAQELGLSFGRERAIHAALAAGGLTTRIVEEAARLQGLRATSAVRTAGPGARKEQKDT
jgi:uncharacterized protein